MPSVRPSVLARSGRYWYLALPSTAKGPVKHKSATLLKNIRECSSRAFKMVGRSKLLLFRQVDRYSALVCLQSVVKAPLYCQISLSSYVLNSQNPGYKFAQKISLGAFSIWSLSTTKQGDNMFSTLYPSICLASGGYLWGVQYNARSLCICK